MEPSQTPEQPHTNLNTPLTDSTTARFEAIRTQVTQADTWEQVIELFRKTYPNPQSDRVRVVAMGDLHGVSPQSILEDLQRIGFLDKDFKVSNPQGRIFLQIGDIFDRGAFGMEDYQLLCDLQAAAPQHTVRLFGNHDFFHLIGMPEWIHAKPIPGLQDLLINDVLQGKILLAWTEGDTIYSHAGIDLNFFPEYRGKSNKEIVDDLNQKFVSAVQQYVDDLKAGQSPILLAEDLMKKHRIFDTDLGVLWTRSSISNEQFRQVVGHTPQQNGLTPSLDGRVMYIDTGRVFAEQGRCNPDQARALFANPNNTIGIQYLAKHPEVFREHKQRSRGTPPPAK